MTTFLHQFFYTNFFTPIFLHQFFYTVLLQQFFTPIFFTQIFYTNFLHQFFTPFFYTHFLHTFFTPIFFQKIFFQILKFGVKNWYKKYPLLGLVRPYFAHIATGQNLNFLRNKIRHFNFNEPKIFLVRIFSAVLNISNFTIID